MRLFTLAVCCAVLVTSFADPEPKKYKSGLKKNKTNNTLTAEEKDFLREVEAKFGIKSEVKDKKDETETKPIPSEPQLTPAALKLPFPAVIAIEIVNDTDTKAKGKGKRTIDANLGYGYKTNNGYSYTYFGKPSETQGKFMIYPYSQEDIPPARGHNNKATEVEITPSRAYELVSDHNENQGYYYPKPSPNVGGLISPPPPAYSGNAHQGTSPAFIPSTLYTTYNGHELSGLSGHFPSVMPNYFVDSSQLLRNPEYQNAGLTDDHLRPHGAKIADQRVVPVLVLRIPSSSLNNPTAELFANLPSNYPLSRYLNNVNLQGLVNQYFKKHGYSFAPQVMHYQNSLLSSDQSAENYGRQHYATPHVQPSYTQSDQSGVQYSAVQPVMAKYPSSYTQRLNLPHGHSLYHQPLHQQKFEYHYQYPQHVPSSHQMAVPQNYYVQPQYHQPTQEVQVVPETNQHVQPSATYEQSPHGVAQEHYEVPSQQIQESQEEDTGSYEYRSQAPEVPGHESSKAVYGYLQQQKELTESASPTYGDSRGAEGPQQYYTQEAPQDKETKVIFHPRVNQLSNQAHSQEETGVHVQYQYQQQNSEEADNLVLTENYPSKDHTIATVLPASYTAKQPGIGVQTVSYVTPMPYTSKYQSPYRIMVPQTFLTNPSTEKVTYVNSHSVSAFTHPTHSQQELNSEDEYTVGPHHNPPVGKQQAPSYPRNYHSHPKRMAKPENKQESPMFSRKPNDRNDKKKI